MELQMTDLGNASKIALQGALDTPGVDQIETRFTASIVSSGKHALVDLSPSAHRWASACWSPLHSRR